MAASLSNSKLRNAWAICQSQTPPVIPTYGEHFDYLMFHSKQLEASVINNTSTRKANSLETDYLTPNSTSDTYFSYSSDLSHYMGNQDVDMVQYTLECNQAMKEGRPHPPQRTQREPARDELKIPNPTWGVLNRDLKKAWIKESDINKEKSIAHFEENLSLLLDRSPRIISCAQMNAQSTS